MILAVDAIQMSEVRLMSHRTFQTLSELRIKDPPKKLLPCDNTFFLSRHSQGIIVTERGVFESQTDVPLIIQQNNKNFPFFCF
jgi:hypothetical protein